MRDEVGGNRGGFDVKEGFFSFWVHLWEMCFFFVSSFWFFFFFPSFRFIESFFQFGIIDPPRETVGSINSSLDGRVIGPTIG